MGLRGHHSRYSTLLPLHWPLDTPGPFLPLDFHPWCSSCPSLPFGAPLIFLSFQSPHLTCGTLPHAGEPSLPACLDCPQRSTCPLPGPFFFRGQQPTKQQMKFWVCLADLPLPGWLSWDRVTAERCPIKLCAMSNVCSVDFLKTHFGGTSRCVVLPFCTLQRG